MHGPTSLELRLRELERMASIGAYRLDVLANGINGVSQGLIVRHVAEGTLTVVSTVTFHAIDADTSADLSGVTIAAAQGGSPIIGSPFTTPGSGVVVGSLTALTTVSYTATLTNYHTNTGTTAAGSTKTIQMLRNRYGAPTGDCVPPSNLTVTWTYTPGASGCGVGVGTPYAGTLSAVCAYNSTTNTWFSPIITVSDYPGVCQVYFEIKPLTGSHLTWEVDLVRNITNVIVSSFTSGAPIYCDLGFSFGGNWGSGTVTVTP